VARPGAPLASPAVADDRHIALAGFMGAGKSSLGPVIAGALERPFFDTDVEVERRGRTIRDFFGAGEERLFRALEALVVRELVDGPPAVIALGGGALQDEGTQALLDERALLVHLAVPWELVRDELPELLSTRPLLQGRSELEIHQLFLRRERNYARAHLRVELQRVGVEPAAEQVLERLREHA
jgi:shikimate kinase